MEDISKIFKYAMLFPIIVAYIVCIMIVPVLAQNNNIVNDYKIISDDLEFVWPTPGFYKISSYFGKRNSPTTGASSYHQGVDILAYQGSKVLSFTCGTVTFAGWDNAGGYMIKIKHDNNIETAYCHLSEELLVGKGESVQIGQVIGTVGPKYVSGGKLNGATTGVHLHFAVYSSQKAVNPLLFFE